MTRLTIEEEGKTSVYEILDADEVTIGRGGANQVQLRDRRASKHHAAIRRIHGRWKLVDLESKNGTRVGQTYRNQHWLEPGDAVGIGRAVVHFDAGPAAAPAAPAAPAARPAPPPAPVAPAPAAPAAPRRPAAAAPAPSRAPAAAATPARAQAPRRAARHDPDDGEFGPDDDRGRYSHRKKGLDSSVIMLVGGVAAVGFIVVMFLALGGGTSVNQEVLIKADVMANNQQDYEGAIRYAETHGDPYADHWERLHDRINTWKGILAQEKVNEKNAEAAAYLQQHITRRTETSGFRPVKEIRLSEPELADLLRSFLRDFEGSAPALDIISERPGEPWVTFRRILRENAMADADVNGILGEAQRREEELLAGDRYGEAIRHYEELKQTQRLLLKPELFMALSERVDRRILRLEQDAQAAFTRGMAEVDRLLKLGEKNKAIATLKTMIDAYQIDKLRTAAEIKLDEIR